MPPRQANPIRSASAAIPTPNANDLRTRSFEDDPDAEKDHGDGEFHGADHADWVPDRNIGIPDQFESDMRRRTCADSFSQ